MEQAVMTIQPAAVLNPRALEAGFAPLAEKLVSIVISERNQGDC
jgi:hypothetical protein